jgi:hypothetical protein
LNFKNQTFKEKIEKRKTENELSHKPETMKNLNRNSKTKTRNDREIEPETSRSFAKQVKNQNM